jgi:hypothetical protein
MSLASHTTSGFERTRAIGGERRRAAVAVRPLAIAAPLPATSVHPAAIGIGVAAYAWLILASWLAFAQGETALTLAVVTVLSLVYFGLLIGGAAVSRDMTPERSQTRSFRAFLEGDVDTATGTISGFEALWQVAGMAVSLAVGGTIIILSAVVLR